LTFGLASVYYIERDKILSYLTSVSNIGILTRFLNRGKERYHGNFKDKEYYCLVRFDSGFCFSRIIRRQKTRRLRKIEGAGKVKRESIRQAFGLAQQLEEQCEPACSESQRCPCTSPAKR